jgi:hypothetical protein
MWVIERGAGGVRITDDLIGSSQDVKMWVIERPTGGLPHKGDTVRRLIEERGATLRFLPP